MIKGHPITTQTHLIRVLAQQSGYWQGWSGVEARSSSRMAGTLKRRRAGQVVYTPGQVRTALRSLWKPPEKRAGL